jgi:hypothetical protein
MTMNSVKKLVAVTCVSLFLVGGWASAVHAQAIHEGKLTGTVASEDQAVIPGATVEISSPALLSGREISHHDGNGTYLFLNLPPGRYKVTTSISGFKTVVQGEHRDLLGRHDDAECIAAGGRCRGDRQRGTLRDRSAIQDIQ